MRFVSWNCCQGFAKDVAALQELRCDVGVLAEVPQLHGPPDLFYGPRSWHWTGDNVRKGLAIAGFGPGLVSVDAAPCAGRWSSAALLPEYGVGLLGVWSCPTRPSSDSYGRSVIDTTTAHERFLTDRPCVVAGDFNMNPNGSADRRFGHLLRVFEELADLGYRSLYHHWLDEAYGEETRPTYFHRWKRDDPFHIDFMFCSESMLPSVTDFGIGAYDVYVAPRSGRAGLSDHVPLWADLDL